MKENWKFSELEYVRPDFEKVKENLKASIDKMKLQKALQKPYLYIQSRIMK